MEDDVKELVEALEDLANNADEDCPEEYRTDHFNTSLTDARELIQRIRRK